MDQIFTITKNNFASLEEVNKFLVSLTNIKVADKEILKYSQAIVALLLEVSNGRGNYSVSRAEEMILRLLDKNLNIQGKEKELSHQLKTICAVLGIGGLSYSTLQLDKVKSKLDNINSEEEYFSIIRTFIEAMKDKSCKELYRQVSPVFDGYTTNMNAGLSWDRSVLFVLFLNLAFVRFHHLMDEEQRHLLINYFCLAVIYDVPVVEALADALYETDNIIDYLILDNFYLEALKNNKEKVFDDYLSNIISKFENQNKEFTESNFKKFVDCSSADKQKNSYLLSCLKIYLHLKKADLITENRGHELPDEAKFFNAMVRLVAYFAIGKVGFDEIIKYFKVEENKKTIASFLGILRGIINLNDAIQLENIIEFTRLMTANDIGNAELIYFDESDGKFYWNPPSP